MTQIRFFEGTTGTAVITLPSSVDLATLTPTLHVRAKVSDTALFTLSVGSGLTILDGKIFVRVAPEQSSGKAGNYRWQLKLTGESGVYVSEIGDWFIEKAVAR